MANTKFRNYCHGKGVYLYELCEKLSISEPTLTRRLRKELEGDTLTQYMAIVDEIAEEREENGL